MSWPWYFDLLGGAAGATGGAAVGLSARYLVGRIGARTERRREQPIAADFQAHPYLSRSFGTRRQPPFSALYEATIPQPPHRPERESRPMTKHHTHPDPGPVDLKIDAGVAEVRITASTTGTARVTVETNATGGPVYDAVRDTVIASDGRRLTVTMPKRASVPKGTVNISGESVNIRSFSGQSIIQAGGRTFVNGVEVTGPRVSDKITITAAVPADTNIDVHTAVGDVVVDQAVGSAHVRTDTGDMRVSRAASADLKAGVGDIHLGYATTAELKSGTGDIKVEAAHTLKASTSVGDIRIRDARGRAEARSGVGDIKITYSGPYPPITHTGVGSVRTTKTEPADRT